MIGYCIEGWGRIKGWGCFDAYDLLELSNCKEKLSEFVINYLTNKTNTYYLKEAIRREQKKFEDKNFGLNISPLEFLFNNDSKVIELVEEDGQKI